MATESGSAPGSTSTVSGIDNISKILNKKVDLITNSNIRYEGMLIQIKTQDQRLLLKDVKSFGTEGRNNGVNEVPTPAADDPNNLYAFVEFQIPMIKELYLAKTQPGPVPEDPAIVSVKQEDAPKSSEPKLEKFHTSGGGQSNFFDDDNGMGALEDEYQPQRGYRGNR
jgi:hypothetical protein